MLQGKIYNYDYEKYPLGYVVTGLNDSMIEIVFGDKNHGFKKFDEARVWAKVNIARIYSDEETGGKGIIHISSNTIQKYLTSSAISKSESEDVHLSVLKILPQAIKNGVEAEVHPDFKKVNGNRLPENGINYNAIIHRIFAAVLIDNELFRVKITLKEFTDNNAPIKPHSYEATKIELIDTDLIANNDMSNNISSILTSKKNSLAGTLVNARESTNPNTNNFISAAKLLKNVEMSYWKGKKLLE